MSLMLIVLIIHQRNIFGFKNINPYTIPTVAMKRLSSNNEIIDPNYISPEVAQQYSNLPPSSQQFVTQIKNHEGCRMEGYLDIYKVFLLLYKE